MFCGKCGAPANDGQNFCAKCGAPISNIAQAKTVIRESIDRTERSIGGEFDGMRRDLNGNRYGSYGAPEPLKSDRTLGMYIILTIITCGFYSFWFLYHLAKDVNTACDGDGETTGGLVAFILLSGITCGLYAYYWHYKLGNRLCANAGRYGLTFQENGTTILLWDLIGVLLCGIGPFVAMNILMKNSNAICSAYNRAHGLSAV